MDSLKSYKDQRFDSKCKRAQFKTSYMALNKKKSTFQSKSGTKETELMAEKMKLSATFELRHHAVNSARHKLARKDEVP